MSDEQDMLRGRGPRLDLDESFPPELLEPSQPALLTDMPSLTAALAAARVLRTFAMRGATRIKPSAIDALIRQLERSVSQDVRAHCRDEALRTLRWIDDAPPPDASAPPPRDELEHMRRSEVDSRLRVANWAFEQGLDLEMEWYDPDARAWPRGRVRLVSVDGDAATITIETGVHEETIAIRDIRLLMPVQPSTQPTTPANHAKILTFPGFSEEE